MLKWQEEVKPALGVFRDYLHDNNYKYSDAVEEEILARLQSTSKPFQRIGYVIY